MDPLRILVRVVLAYVLLLILMRLSGKRVVKQANPFDFTIALIVGDLVDDLLWAEVNAAVFVMATGTLVLMHVAFDLLRYRAGLLQR